MTLQEIPYRILRVDGRFVDVTGHRSYTPLSQTSGRKFRGGDTDAATDARFV